jgi:xylulokinase
MKHYLGYDCGTMGTKVAIFAEDGTMVADAYRPHIIEYPKPGWAEMNPEQFYGVTSEGIGECMRKSGVSPRDIRGISASGVICGIVPIDEGWNATGPYIPYLDGRSKEEAAWVSEHVEPLWVEEGGNSVIGSYYPPMMLKWLLKNEKALVSRSRKVVTGAHYVMGKLGGLTARDAFIDWSHLSGWVIGFDARKRNWSDRQIELLGLPREMLPRVSKPWDVVGALTGSEARKLGLAEGTPLVAGGGDMQQSCLGSGVVETGVCSDVAGTASNFNYSVGEFRREITDKKVLMLAMHTLDDQYLYWAVVPGGGLSLRWFRDAVVMQKGDEGFYDRMNELAERAPPGADFSLYYPYIQGRVSPFWAGASAAWLGLYGSNDSGTLWRSMMEGIAFEYLMWMNILRNAGVKPKRIVGQGGGSKSRLWNQIKADVLGVPYVTLKNQEQAVMGNAMLAAFGVGDIKDLKKAACEWIRVKETFLPVKERNELYARIFDKREKMLNGPMREIFDTLSELHELRAGTA